MCVLACAREIYSRSMLFDPRRFFPTRQLPFVLQRPIFSFHLVFNKAHFLFLPEKALISSPLYTRVYSRPIVGRVSRVKRERSIRSKILPIEDYCAPTFCTILDALDLQSAGTTDAMRPFVSVRVSLKMANYIPCTSALRRISIPVSGTFPQSRFSRSFGPWRVIGRTLFAVVRSNVFLRFSRIPVPDGARRSRELEADCAIKIHIFPSNDRPPPYSIRQRNKAAHVIALISKLNGHGSSRPDERQITR